MKIAYIILGHKNPQQIVRLVRRLIHPDNYFFIHIDKNADKKIYENVFEQLKDCENVKFIKRFASVYASFGIVEATLEGLKQALLSKIPFDYFINLSGQDYPIKNNAQIARKLSSKKEVSYLWYFPLPLEEEHSPRGRIVQKLNRVEFWYIRYKKNVIRLPQHGLRKTGVFATIKHSPLWILSKLFLPKKRKFPAAMIPYGGGQWWCLCRKHAEYIYEFTQNNKKFCSFFKYANVPDEIFFQTILLNSVYASEVVNNDLRLLMFEETSSHPKIYTLDDFSTVAESEQLFARKFDFEKSGEKLLDMIDDSVRQ